MARGKARLAPGGQDERHARDAAEGGARCAGEAAGRDMLSLVQLWLRAGLFVRVEMMLMNSAQNNRDGRDAGQSVVMRTTRRATDRKGRCDSMTDVADKRQSTESILCRVQG